MSRELLRDLYGHQEWADAQHWTALQAHPGALDDAKLRERLHHILLVQRYFLSVARQSGPPDRPQLSDFGSMGEMKAEARRYHESARAFVTTASDDAPDSRRLRPIRHSTLPRFSSAAMRSRNAGSSTRNSSGSLSVKSR